MTTTLETQADQICMYALVIQRTETELEYCAGMIAGMAADDETDTPVFRSQVLRYRELRESLRSVKAAYQEALNA